MAYFVISYPELQTDDLEFIQSIRREHDPQYPLVKPHFTLVFAFTAPELADVIDHIAEIARAHPPFGFHLRRAATVLDSVSDATHVFLIPEKGNAELVELHDALYTGMLARFLRSDLPYIPHITVAAKAIPDRAGRLAEMINARGVSIPGLISSLSLVERNDEGLKTIHSFPLSEDPPAASYSS
jgi:2'-5' RNA ligase